jgi:hypothetical protein
MGFGSVISSIAKSVANITGISKLTGKPEEDGPPDPIKFKINGQDWYKVFGYQFGIIYENEFGSKSKKQGLFSSIKNTFLNAAKGDSNEKSKFYTLPIPPQNIVIKPIIASQATPTFGGVVEETSQNVLWLISMQGTTGIAPSRDANGQAVDRKEVAKNFRETISTTGLLSGISGQLQATTSRIGGALDSFITSRNALKDGNIAGAIGNAVNIPNTLAKPPLPYSGSGVSEQSNGFTEIQELVKFFDDYNKLKHENPRQYRLIFRMFKTNQQWDCIIEDFSIQKSAQSPHLWRYNIVMTCWALQVIGANVAGSEEFDRFGSDGDLASVNTVGLASSKTLSNIASRGGFFRF